jgi:hypothetical protein
VTDNLQMLVDSKACNPTSTLRSSNKINQLEVTGKTRTEPNDLDQSKFYKRPYFLSTSSNFSGKFELIFLAMDITCIGWVPMDYGALG